MLPKVATHILHSTVTRTAAAAVQNQANLRNVLQLHPSGAPGTGSSSSSGQSGQFHSSNVSSGAAGGLAAVSSASSASAVSKVGVKANPHGGSSHGPNSGGTKKNKPGSRFYTGYNAAARAVTQANALTSQDAPATQLEESEDMHPAARRALLKKSASPAAAKRPRLRSSSVNSLLGRGGDKDKKDMSLLGAAEKVGVLKTVQLQARSLHVLTAAQQQSQAGSTSSAAAAASANPAVEAQAEVLEVLDDLATPPPPVVLEEQAAVDAVNVAVGETQETTKTPSRSPSPSRPRSNSTSSPVSIPSTPLIHPQEVPTPVSPLLAFEQPAAAESTPLVEVDQEDVVSSRSATPSSPSSSSVVSETESAATTAPSESGPRKDYREAGLTVYGETLRAALANSDAAAIVNIVETMNKLPEDAAVTIADFNMALEAIGVTRKGGEPLHLTLETYNTILNRSLRPNVRTYLLLIDQFTTRDWEVYRILETAKATKTRKWTEDHIARLEAENNFQSAMKLFEAIIMIGGNSKLSFSAYKKLMQSCGIHANVSAALNLLSHVEKRHYNPDPDLYRFLMQAFSNSGDFKGAELVFQKYKRKEEKGELHKADSAGRMHTMQVQVWNQMMDVYFRKEEPEKAIGLLDDMLKAPSPPPPSSDTASLSSTTEGGLPKPSPTSATFTTIIAGFLHLNDLESALKWFYRLLSQTDPAPADPLVPLHGGRPMRPDPATWTLITDALAKHNRIDELNALFTTGDRVGLTPRRSVLEANLASLRRVGKDVGARRLAFVREHFVDTNSGWGDVRHRATFEVGWGYVRYGMLEEAGEMVVGVVNREMDAIEKKGVATTSLVQQELEGVVQQMQNLVLWLAEETSARLGEAAAAEGEGAVEWSLGSALALARVGMERLGLGLIPEQGMWLLHAYGKARNAGEVGALELGAWKVLVTAAVNLEAAKVPASPAFAFQGLSSLLEDMAASGVQLTEEVADAQTRMAAVHLASQGRNAEWSREFFSKLGPSYLAVYEEVVKTHFQNLEKQLEEAKPSSPPIDMLSPPSPTRSYGRNLPQLGELSRAIDQILKNGKLSLEHKVEQAYEKFEAGLASKKAGAPHVSTIGRLIQACGRANDLEKVQELYRVGQALISMLKSATFAEYKRQQMWVSLEDNMIIALAHAGDIEAAHVHRRRIQDLAREVKQPFTASADAYGALILNVKDTTDDASNSMMLWNEAMQSGVQPNLYLYNNIISKLARARKVDQALELFHQMRAAQVIPSSITYGAIIGACVRVGDAVSAEALFKEMTEQPNFKPRVPPFNTMMQMYTTTRPDRERALWYYMEMLKQGVAPTAHTYKLLLDAYGSVESVDLEALDSVWNKLKADTSVQINGTHFASLINAYGCVLRDLNRAISVFESIPNEYGVARDAVVYEALVNALVANKRTDLIREYMERMMVDGVHMTAYVANFLIKGYANVGDVEQARVIFESMMDPPTGVAAPNNHAPHVPVEGGVVGVMEPVYREPSTWEAMIRGEMGAGNKERAFSLLERLRARQYPEAVFNRISGVMVDHSMPSL